jgi:hypothetical protein
VTDAALLPYVLKRVLPAAAILLLGVWGVVHYTVITSLESDVQASLSDEAEQLATALSARLTGLVDTAQSIATNDLVVNGLVDTLEADAYLSVMFRSLRIPGPSGAEVYLTDYRGRVIAANTVARNQLSYWVTPVMAGEDVVSIGGFGLLIATPVHYAGAPEGAVVLRYPPALLSQVLNVGGKSEATTVLDNDGNVFFISNEAFLSEGVPWSRAAQHRWMQAEANVPAYTDLQVVSATRNSTALAFVEQIDNIMMIAILAGLLVLTAGIVFTALITTRPLSRLAREVRQL